MVKLSMLDVVAMPGNLSPDQRAGGRRTGRVMRTFARSAALVVLAYALELPAQVNDPAQVSLERLFASRDFSGEALGRTEWLPDGSGYSAIERSTSGRAGAVDIVQYDAASGRRTILVASERLIPRGDTVPLAVESYSWSPNNTKLLIFTNSERVWRDNTRGDYWVLDLRTQRLQRLGTRLPRSSLMFAKFSPQSDRVAYVSANNIYVERLTTGGTVQLTRDGSRTTINGTTDWVYEEELGLRDAFQWSPDGSRIAYWQLDATGVRDFLMINNTDSLYSFTIPVQYPKVGETNSAARIGVVSAAGGATRWMRIPGDPREHYLARMSWVPDGKAVVIQQLNRKQNTLTLFRALTSTGVSRPLLIDRDSAWVNVVDDFLWFDNGARFTWVSERDGWRHVYVHAQDGTLERVVTPGDYDVDNVVQIDDKGGWVYFTASPESGIRRALYRAPLRGDGAAERLTPMNDGGVHRYDLAPGARYAIRTVSSFGVPPTTDLVAIPGHTRVRALVNNDQLKGTVSTLRRGKQEFIRVPIERGVELDGYLMYPPDFDPARRYPVLFHVYGEPAAQTVMDQWGGRNYLWHVMLTQAGYVVASVDNRGTPSLRGRDWRKSIYGKIGILNSSDQAAAARVMLEKYSFLDPERVGVWGWSGGGSMTLNLLFRSPELYQVGMSVAPVGDQRNYDSIYQERYMGLLTENESAFIEGSPVTYADRLRGKLLLVHGTGDDNVHYQNAEQVVNKLVEANRPFTMMSYPNRSHGISERPNTSRHVFELLTRYLRENLPPGAREATRPIP